MSFSIVRTCRRCGTRSERDVLNEQQLEWLFLNLVHHLRCPSSDDGCPDCCPELVPKTEIDRELWRQSVERARSRAPQ